MESSLIRIPTPTLANVTNRNLYYRGIIVGDNTVIKLLHKGLSAKRQEDLSEAMPDLLVPIIDIGEIVERFPDNETATLGNTIECIVMPKLNVVLDENMLIIEKYRELLPQILEKVDKLHSLGYIHGDLHIMNILVDNSGTGYLSDLDTMINRNEIRENPELFDEILGTHSYEGKDIDGFMAYERAEIIEDFLNEY